MIFKSQRILELNLVSQHEISSCFSDFVINMAFKQNIYCYAVTQDYSRWNRIDSSKQPTGQAGQHSWVISKERA